MVDHSDTGFSKPLSWMQTYTGRRWIPTLPNIDAIRIEDIAHSTSMQCRYAGHCLEFYSIAEHQVHMFNHAKRAKRECLLHDGTEAYLVDVPRGVKEILTGYKTIEDQYAKLIAKKFDLIYPWPDEVHELDARILLDERAQNMPPYYMEAGPFTPMKPAGYGYCQDEADGWPFHLEPLGIELQFWPPKIAEIKFLEAFHASTSSRH